ncbi:hypothetical protein ACQ4PT_041628 [Festuca glaucescens]
MAPGVADAVEVAGKVDDLPVLRTRLPAPSALKDTASSPLKGKDMDIDGEGNPISGTKRNLAEQFSEEGDLPELGVNGTVDGAASAAMLTESISPVDGSGDGKGDDENCYMIALEEKVKLLVDTKAQLVLFAEADMDVVEFLFSLLALAVGTTMKLLGADSMVVSACDLSSSALKLAATSILPCEK